MTAPSDPGSGLTRSAEDYLKAIYRLTLTGDPASTSDLAGSLGLAPASVSGMLRRLAEQGLVNHLPYRGVELSRAGRRVALRMVRRHRLIETYLVAELGYTWDTVHEEAERLEHAVSDDLVERMARALGNPRVDPHGDPIPGPDGRLAELVYTPLTDFDTGEVAEVRRVMATEPERLRYIGHAGLTPGVRVTVVKREPFEGPVTFRLRGRGRERVIGGEIAGQILCSRIE